MLPGRPHPLPSPLPRPRAPVPGSPSVRSLRASAPTSPATSWTRRRRRCRPTPWGGVASRPGGHVLFEQPLVIGPAGVVGVRHLPDDVARLSFEFLQREIQGQRGSGGDVGFPGEPAVTGVSWAGWTGTRRMVGVGGRVPRIPAAGASGGPRRPYDAGSTPGRRAPGSTTGGASVRMSATMQHEGRAEDGGLLMSERVMVRSGLFTDGGPGTSREPVHGLWGPPLPPPRHLPLLLDGGPGADRAVGLGTLWAWTAVTAAPPGLSGGDPVRSGCGGAARGDPGHHASDRGRSGCAGLRPGHAPPYRRRCTPTPTATKW